MPSAADAYRLIYAVVSRIPRGRVATYGQVATVAGLPRRARLVGTALAALPTGSDVPWHRVVNVRGQVSPRANALGYEDLQAQLLRREGIVMSAGASIPLGRYQWRPGAPSAAREPRARR